MKDLVKEINARIDELEAMRENVTARAAAELEALRESLDQLKEAQTKAAKDLDFDAVHRTTDDILRTERQIEVIEASGLDSVRRNSIVTEEESDRVIDSILERQKELDADLMKDVAELCLKLEKVCTEYKAKGVELGAVADRWISSIHDNYRNLCGSGYKLESPVRVWPIASMRPGNCAVYNDSVQYLKTIRRDKRESRENC